MGMEGRNVGWERKMRIGQEDEAGRWRRMRMKVEDGSWG